MSDTNQLRIGAFVTLLAAGILIALGGLMAPFMFGASGWSGAMPMGGMMDAYGPAGGGPGAVWWMGGVSAVAGALVLMAAFQVRRRQHEAAWSVVAIVAGAASLFTMGGFVLGALTAIVGGVLGLAAGSEPSRRARDA